MATQMVSTVRILVFAFLLAGSVGSAATVEPSCSADQCKPAGTAIASAGGNYLKQQNQRRLFAGGDSTEDAEDTAAKVYAPGTPGAPWTLEETLIVKSKLHYLMKVGKSYEGCNEAGISGCKWTTAGRLAPKFLRLGFHDCLKYTDGTGGCDGVLHWEGMDETYGNTAGSWSIDANDTLSHNNGLAHAVMILEELYTNPDFPASHKVPTLSDSLRNLGKSRADLWAFAAIVAVEYGIHVNNGVCNDPLFETTEGYGLDTNGGEKRHCHPMQGTPECVVTLTRPIKFKTGRVDSSSSYEGTKWEHMPMAEGSGKMTVEFYKEVFGFDGRETVAIMGAHTMGRMHNGFSLFKYVWIHKGGTMFNNQYYRNMAGKPQYRWVGNCETVGSAWQELPPSRWVTHVRGDKVTGGPVHWIQESLTCPTACVNSDQDHACCAEDVPAGATCRPDAGRAKGTDPEASDNDVNGGCESFRFVSGHDQSAIPAEMGLYYDFQVDEDFAPYGCPGFKDFNKEKWKKGYHLRWSRIDGKKADPQCPKQTLQEPAGRGTKLHEIVEEYADSQEAWIRDFVPAFEKMLSNGYAQNELEDGPDQYSGVDCIKAPMSLCYKKWRGNAQLFFIVCEHDGRALQHNDQGKLQLYTKVATNRRQMWYWQGDMLINERTKLPLITGGHKTGQLYSWTPEDILVDKVASWYTPPPESKVLASGNKCIDRGWGDNDKTSLGVADCMGNPVQRFTFQDA